MTLEVVHRRGVQVAVLLSTPLVVIAALVAFGIAKGFAVWWPLILLALSLLLVALGAVDAVRVYLTRGWPKVEADAVGLEDRGMSTCDSHVVVYSQRLVYVYQNQWFESPLKWTWYPPTQVVLRVNPAQPTEVFCVEQLGWSWVVSLLSAVAIPPIVGVSLAFGWGWATELLVVYVFLGGAIWLGSRLRPNDRADSFGAEASPNIRLYPPPRRSRAASRRG
jgi:hypothetical protein